MRKWGELHPALRAVLVGVVAWAVILAIGLIVGASLEDAIANAVFYALMIGGGLFFLTKRFPTSTATLDDQDKSVMFLRFPHSPPGSLSSSWQRGIASPGPGRIDFQPALYEQLVPSGRSKALTGLRATDSPPRKANHHDHQQDVPLDFLVVVMESDGGVIEIAASPATLRKIQQDVGSTSS
ncbi:hypothetical protein QF031_001647 [Pseudarthrobacter defluvii]|uniref:hypothetical protein n=1 Tax=Pseudarthrobacter defluvii TaxID=410837 RepID=UPI002780ECE4|nr:hypothetical protein [Pseudarthrobacter defluvii]MDQ0768898.1 hypothetical protein [Pseudarthrobacter defluvii]